MSASMGIFWAAQRETFQYESQWSRATVNWKPLVGLLSASSKMLHVSKRWTRGPTMFEYENSFVICAMNEMTVSHCCEMWGIHMFTVWHAVDTRIVERHFCAPALVNRDRVSDYRNNNNRHRRLIGIPRAEIPIEFFSYEICEKRKRRSLVPRGIFTANMGGPQGYLI